MNKLYYFFYIVFIISILSFLAVYAVCWNMSVDIEVFDFFTIPFEAMAVISVFCLSVLKILSIGKHFEKINNTTFENDNKKIKKIILKNVA